MAISRVHGEDTCLALGELGPYTGPCRLLHVAPWRVEAEARTVRSAHRPVLLWLPVRSQRGLGALRMGALTANRSVESDTQRQGAARRVGDRTPRDALPLCAAHLQR